MMSLIKIIFRQEHQLHKKRNKFTAKKIKQKKKSSSSGIAKRQNVEIFIDRKDLTMLYMSKKN